MKRFIIRELKGALAAALGASFWVLCLCSAFGSDPVASGFWLFGVAVLSLFSWLLTVDPFHANVGFSLQKKLLKMVFVLSGGVAASVVYLFIQMNEPATMGNVMDVVLVMLVVAVPSAVVGVCWAFAFVMNSCDGLTDAGQTSIQS